MSTARPRNSPSGRSTRTSAPTVVHSASTAARSPASGVESGRGVCVDEIAQLAQVGGERAVEQVIRRRTLEGERGRGRHGQLLRGHREVESGAHHHRVGPPAPPRRGCRTPSPPPTCTSFGHLSPTRSLGPGRSSSRTARHIASPASSGTQPSRSSVAPGGASSTDTASAVPGGATQVRPSRPRPAVWFVVASTVKCSCGVPSGTRSRGGPGNELRVRRAGLVEQLERGHDRAGEGQLHPHRLATEFCGTHTNGGNRPFSTVGG